MKKRFAYIAIPLILTLLLLGSYLHKPKSSETLTPNIKSPKQEEKTIGDHFKELFGKPFEETCKSNPDPVFTYHITDTTKINSIVIPPNFIGGDLKTHSYIETDFARVPIYAPIDMTLDRGSFYTHGPYRLDFEVSCEVMLRFMHITEPIESIRNVFPDEPAPAGDSKDQPLKNEIDFKAGDLIGYTTGTYLAGNWDFGVYNSTKENKYAKDEKFKWSTIYTTATCPYDYFSPELKAEYEKNYNQRINNGAKPDGESFCK